MVMNLFQFRAEVLLPYDMGAEALNHINEMFTFAIWNKLVTN